MDRQVAANGGGGERRRFRGLQILVKGIDGGPVERAISGLRWRWNITGSPDGGLLPRPIKTGSLLTKGVHDLVRDWLDQIRPDSAIADLDEGLDRHARHDLGTP